MKRKKRTYSVKTRGGDVVTATVDEGKVKRFPLHHGKESVFQYAKMTDLPLPVRWGGGVIDGCEFMLRNLCSGEATKVVTTKWSSGESVRYLMCESCAEGLIEELTPHSNTGSKTSSEGA